MDVKYLSRSVQLAALAAPAQAERLLRLYTPEGPDVLVAETVQGWEALDAGYRLDVTALSVDAHLDLQALVGKPVLLEIRTDAGDYRPVHGRIVAIERINANGGLARYRLVIEPGPAMLRYGRDTFVFRDKTWIEITQEILGWYPALAPPVRLNLKDPAAYLRYDQWTLYEESPLNALLRLWADEGIFHFYEHLGDPGSDTFGSHTLVLADHNGAFGPETPAPYAYHRKDASEPRDTVQQVRERRRLRPTLAARASWDYRSLDLRQASASAAGPVALEDRDVCGPYAYHTRAEGERRAHQHLDALRLDAHTLRCAGALRRLTAGQRFAITRHHGIQAEQGWISRLVHFEARNNFGVEMGEEIEALLGRTELAAPALPAVLSGLASLPPLPQGPERTDTFADGEDGHAGYFRNTFHAIPAEVPYRPQTADGHGRRLYPRRRVQGLVPAVVVGDGGPLHTDRDHRIKVQLVSRRGDNASNQQAHPVGADNAPGKAGGTMWVRVATPWAGDNWGTVWVPRVGELVNLTALEGDPDRLVVVAACYDGRGNDDAPHNQVAGGPAGATGNAPAWFEGNEHAAVMAGIKTQALQSSQDGAGGFNQLVFDDTPGQGRVQLSTTQADTALTLGHLKRQRDNLREADRGFGTELRTEASAALRAGSGLLITTEPGRQQLTATGALAQLQQSEQLLTSLAQTAKGQLAQLPDDPAPEQQPAVEALKHTQEVMAATQTGSAPGAGIGGGEGEVPAWSEPLQVVSSPAGIAALTPASLVAVSGTQTVHAADQDINWAAQDVLSVAVAKGVQLFTQGQAAGGGKPNTETGIALHAANGPVQVRALKNTATLAAEQLVRLASTTADVAIQAPAKHVLVTAQGAYLKLEGGDIEMGASGTIEFKATRKELTGPQAVNAQSPDLPQSKLKACPTKDQAAAAGGGATM